MKIHHTKRIAPKLSNLTVIGYSKKATPEAIEEYMTAQEQDKKTLIFEVNDESAHKFFAGLSNDCLAGIWEDGAVTPKEKGSMKEKYILVANSFSTLGKAVRLNDYSTVLVNTQLYEPRFKHAQELTPEKIKASIEAYRTELCCQNAGRILGAPGKDKTVIFTNVSESDFAELCQAIKPGNISEKYSVRWIETDEKLIYKIAKKEVGTDEPEEKKLRREYLSKRQRNEKADEIEADKELAKAEKEEQKQKDRIEKVKELKKAGKKWKDVFNNLNLRRLQNEKIAFLKQVFENE